MRKTSKNLLTVGASVATMLLASTTSFAAAAYKGENYKGEAMVPAPCPVEKGLSDGAYVGVQLGYDMYRVGEKINYSSAGASIRDNPAQSANGVVGGLMAGYGKYLTNEYYLGGEVFINDSSASGNNSLYGTQAATQYVYTKFKANSSFGLSLLPGVKLSNSSLLYVRLGYNWANFQGKTTYTATTGAVTNSNKSNTSSGFNYGLGLESQVYGNFSLRGEYNFTRYTAFTAPATGIRFNPQDNQVTLGLLYHFA